MTVLRPSVHLAPEVVGDAHQLRELIVGISALVQHPHHASAVEAARGASLEARAVAERLCAHLDALASIQAEAERAEQAHRVEAARLAGGAR